MILRVESVNTRREPSAPGGMVRTVQLLGVGDEPKPEMVLFMTGAEDTRYQIGQCFRVEMFPTAEGADGV